MMTQSVITQTGSLIYGPAQRMSSSGSQSGNSFDMVMENRLKAGQFSVNAGNNVTKKISNTVESSQQTTDTQTYRDTAKTPDTKVEESSGDETEINVENSNPLNTKTTKKTDDPQLLEQVAVMLQSIRELVMDVLDLTSEELDQFMEEQGMSPVDLLQPDHLQQLFLADKGVTDILELLTDENMSVSLQQLLQNVEGMKESADFQLTNEQIKSLLLQTQMEPERNEMALEDTNSVETQNHDFVYTEDEIVHTGIKEKDEMPEEGTSRVDNQAQGVKSTNVETWNTNTQSDARKDENQNLKAEDQFQAFIDNLVHATQKTETDFSGELVQETQIRDIANQIVDRIKVTMRPGQTSMELQLNPENLGKVNLSVQSRNGIMTAQFVVQNDITKEAIEGQLHVLRDTLNQQGIKVEAIEVTVSAYAFEQSSDQNSGRQSEEQKSNSGRKITLDEALSMTEQQEDIAVQDITGLRGSQVDYTA